MKIPKRRAPLLFALLMSLGMAFIMSAILTLVNVGPVADFPARWMRAFVVGFAAAFPTALAVVPLVRRAVERLTQ
jgi:hypothetical protein